MHRQWCAPVLLAGAALGFGCDTLLKAPDAQYANMRFDAYLKSDKPQANAEFGQSIALDEAGLVATAPFEDVVGPTGAVVPDGGAFYVFDMRQQLAPPRRLTTPNVDPGDASFSGMLLPPGAGSTMTWGAMFVTLDKDWIALGLPGEDSALAPSADIAVEEAQSDNNAEEAGAVYLYRRSNLAEAPKYIKAPNPSAGHLFGYATALSDGWLAVGAVGDSSSNPDDSADDGAKQSGAVFMYRYDASNDDFVFQQYLKAPRIHPGDMFGSAISIERDLMAVGAILEDGAGAGVTADYDDTSAQNVGAVYTYRWTGRQWIFESYLKPADPSTGSLFGIVVRVIDARIAVGTPLGNRCPRDEFGSLLGVAYVFSREHGEWADVQCLSPPSHAQNSLFGFVLNGYGKQLVVGAPWDPPEQAGAAYAFELQASGTWRASAAVVAPNQEALDGFGVAVAINSNTIAVGAIDESGADSGPHASLSSNDAHHAGAVYLFSQ
jgi:hypothetical protein